MSGLSDQIITPDYLSASTDEFDPIREIKLLRRELARRLKSLRERDGLRVGSDIDPFERQDLPQSEAKTPPQEKESYLDTTALGPTKDRTAELFARNLDQTTHFVSVLRQSDVPVSPEAVNGSVTETEYATDETVVAPEPSIPIETSAVTVIDSDRIEIPEVESEKSCNTSSNSAITAKAQPGGIIFKPVETSRENTGADQRIRGLDEGEAQRPYRLRYIGCCEGGTGVCRLTTNDIGKNLVQSIPTAENAGDTKNEQETIGMEQPFSLSFWLDTLNSWLVLFGFLGFLLGGLYLLGDHPRHPEPATVSIVTGLTMLVIGLIGRYLHLNCNQQEGGN